MKKINNLILTCALLVGAAANCNAQNQLNVSASYNDHNQAYKVSFSKDVLVGDENVAAGIADQALAAGEFAVSITKSENEWVLTIVGDGQEAVINTKPVSTKGKGVNGITVTESAHGTHKVTVRNNGEEGIFYVY